VAPVNYPLNYSLSINVLRIYIEGPDVVRWALSLTGRTIVINPINRLISEEAGKLSAKQMSKQCGISENAIYKRAQTLGLSLQRKGQYHPGSKVSDKVVKAAQILYDHGGLVPGKIKDLLFELEGVPENTIWEWLIGRNR